MKKTLHIKILTLILAMGIFFSPAASVFAENKGIHLFFLPTEDSQLWGAVDDKGQLVIPPIYQQLRRFDNDSSFPVPFQDVTAKWGYIDASGTIIHKATLDEARIFTKDGLARFKQDGKWGYIKSSGVYAVAPRYDDARPFSNGYAAVQSGGNWHYIDHKGEVQIKGPFYKAGKFSVSGLAAVKPSKTELLGYINRQGEWIVQPAFDAARVFTQKDHAAVSVNKKWGIIDSRGKWVLKPTYYEMGAFDEHGIADFQYEYNSGGFLDQNGKIVLDRPGEDFYNLRYNSHCEVIDSRGSTVSFYDPRGSAIKKLNSASYRFSSGFNTNCSALVLISGTSRWGRLTSEGKLYTIDNSVLEPFFDTSGDSSRIAHNGTFVPAVTRENKLVYLDKKGKIALRTKTISEDKVETLVVMNAKGKEIWRHSYDDEDLIKTNGYPAFLNPGNLEFGFKEPTIKNISAKIGKLQNQKPRPFEPHGGDFSEEGDSYGVGISLAYYYINEYDVGNYYHIHNSPVFEVQFDRVKELIDSLYGQTDESDEQILDLLYQNNISEDAAYWSVDDTILVLEKYSMYGDGDYEAGLSLMMLPTLASKRQLNDLPTVTADMLTLASVSDAELRAAVQKIIDNQTYSDPVTFRQYAITALEIAREGKPINEFDYLWTQYGLLKACFYDSDELQVGTIEQMTSVAQNLMSFIEKNGLGEDLLTSLGQFRLTVYRYAANMGAWSIRDSQPEKALDMIKRAVIYTQDAQSYMHDTHVRVLLNLEKFEQAYSIVKRVLDENPWFKDFQEFYDDAGYKKWLKRNGHTIIDSDKIPTTSKNVTDKQDIAVHAATNRLAVYWNDEIHLFDIITGKIFNRFNTGTYDPFTLRFNEDGSKLLSSGWGEVSVWDVEKGKRIVREKLPESNSKCAGLNASNTHFYYDEESESGDNTLVIRKLARKKRVFSLGDTGSCNVSSDNRYLSIVAASETGENRLAIVDLENHSIIANLIGDQANAYDEDMFFVKGNTKLLVRDYGDFHLWNIKNEKVERTWKTGDINVNELAVTNDFVSIVDEDSWTKHVWYFDAKPAKKTKLQVPQYARGPIGYKGFLLSSDGKKYTLVTSNSDYSLFYILSFDFESDKLMQEYITPLWTSEPAYANNDKYVILNSYPIQIIDITTGEIVHKISK